MKKVLVVSPIECYPEFYGSSARISSFLKVIIDTKGLDFLYLHLPERPYNEDTMKEALKERYFYKFFKKNIFTLLTIRFKMLISLFLFKKYTIVKIDDFIQQSDIVFFKKVYEEYIPDILIVNYTYYSKLFNYTTGNCLKILDTHDSMYNRFKLIYNNKRRYKNLRISLLDEINCLNRSDIVISIQNNEEQFFKDNGCKSEVITIGHVKDFYQSDISSFKYKILYVGANYSANIESLRNFLINIWPNLNKHFKNKIELLVVGDIFDSFQFESNVCFDNVSFLGRVEDLNCIYDQVDFSINPILYGSGLKIKNVESLSMGKPIVTMTYGIDGLECFLNNGAFVVSDINEWISIFEKLFNNSFYKRTINDIQKIYIDYLHNNKDLFIKLLNRN